MTQRYNYVVRYRRATWTYRQARYFRSKTPAVNFIHKLQTPHRWPDLSPLAEIVLEREERGPAEIVWSVGGRR